MRWMFGIGLKDELDEDEMKKNDGNKCTASQHNILRLSWFFDKKIIRWRMLEPEAGQRQHEHIFKQVTTIKAT